MTTRSLMSFIMGVIGTGYQELFALELGKNAELDFVYTLDSIYKYQPIRTKLVKMNTTIRSQMSLIMDVIRPELYRLSVHELENLLYLTLFTF